MVESIDISTIILGSMLFCTNNKKKEKISFVFEDESKNVEEKWSVKMNVGRKHENGERLMSITTEMKSFFVCSIQNFINFFLNLILEK